MTFEENVFSGPSNKYSLPLPSTLVGLTNGQRDRERGIHLMDQHKQKQCLLERMRRGALATRKSSVGCCGQIFRKRRRKRGRDRG
jgi:hypothetical protein